MRLGAPPGSGRMRAMKLRPVLLLILLYVTLDLSVPAMPGAFVFDTSDSVESTRIRVRAAVETSVLSAPVRDAFFPSRPLLEAKVRLGPAASIERAKPPGLSPRARALDDPAPASEDPH